MHPHPIARSPAPGPDTLPATLAPERPGEPASDSAATLRFLLSPQAHAPDAGTVELIETHMSWVVLDAHQALKLKKPVCYPPLFDCRTLAAREHDGRAELRVNRRLAPDVYLGLLAVQRDQGHWSLLPETALPAPGQTVDWLVQMRRLPADRMLDRLIADARLQPAQVDALALTLSRFYQQALPAPVDEAALLARHRHEQALNRQVLSAGRFGLAEAAPALDRLDAAIEQHAELLRQRVRQHRIVDGHGDLRPEHVCLVEPPVVIDALAFNDGLRQVDPFEELVALALECERLGAAWAGQRLLACCGERLDDLPDPALLQIYRAGRALLRARLAVAHLLDAQPTWPAHWLALGRRYIALSLGPQPGNAGRDPPAIPPQPDRP